MNPDGDSYVINKYVGGVTLSLDEANKLLEDFIRDYGDVLGIDLDEVELILMPDDEGFVE